MQIQRKPVTGILLALIGGLIISLDIPVIRLGDGAPWAFIVFRGFGMSLVLGLILLLGRNLTDTPERPFHDADFVTVGILYGASSILFTTAVFTTSTANLVFILAFNPLVAALFSWWLIGEKPGAVTWIAIALTIFGVGVIVSDGVETGNTFGNILALLTAIVLGLSIVKTRQSGKDMSLAGTLGGMVAGLFALPMVLLSGEMPNAMEWVLLNALIMAPAGAFALSLAPRYIPAPQVAMFFLLETILAPIWVWLVFAETPSERSLIGGAIVLMAITVHSAVQIRRSEQ
ncbi:MAG: DMT family transporter [Rhizobiaceae bacterium]|nr:DMT family transporter [Rhizobiaceae bacterium]